MAETQNNPTVKKKSPNDGDGLRFNLAKWIVVFAFGGIAVLGLCAVLLAAAPGIIYVFQRQGSIADIKEGFSNVKDILGILLPVMSAWAGTVFAFYFTRENFESAAKSTAALVKQLTSEEKLKSIIVKDVMIKIEDADKLILDKDAKEIKLKADIIDAILDAKKRERLPILDKEGHIQYMAHRSLIDKVIAQKAAEDKKVADLTLGDILADDTFGKILKGSYSVVAENSSLADVKTLMEKIENCSDIFVTEDGKPTSKLIGWITDVIVRQQATV